MNILLLSHQLDFSGAPIALFRLAETLLRHGHVVSLGAVQDGPLGKEFVRMGVQQFDRARAGQYELYVANTFFTVPLALNLAQGPDRVIGWIHENRAFFGLYGLNERQYGLEYLQRAIFPSRFMLDEYRDLMPACALRQLRNLVSMEGVEAAAGLDGHCVVSGAWETRKNQARLLQLLAEAGQDIGLAFVGCDRPDSVRDTPHQFFGQVPMAQAKQLIAGSAGAISAAQGETQNLVAIEAILAGRPVLLSDIAAHRELQRLIPGVVLFDPGDAGTFRDGCEQFRRNRQSPALLAESRRVAETCFGPAAFDQAVHQLFDHA